MTTPAPDGELYIASSLLNIPAVRRLRDRFHRDHGIQLSYDWTQYGQVTDAAAMADIAYQEAAGVRRARCLLLLMPARCGSHFEAGIAFALQIPIVLLCADYGQLQTSFHHRPELLKCCSEDAAVRTVLEVLAGRCPQHMMQQWPNQRIPAAFVGGV